MITFGTYTDRFLRDGHPQISCDSALLRPHLGRPWFRGYASRRLGLAWPPPPSARCGAATVPDAALARHALLCGSTGSGKTRLLLHLLVEQLASGCSAVVLDPKGETVDRLLAHVAMRGLPPETVTIVDPRMAAGVPGWNPLHAGVPPAQAAADFVALLEQSSSSWGPRLQDLLTNALLFVGSYPELSLYELARLLVRDEYREALLRRPVRAPDPIAYAEARNYFRDEFGAWSRSERTNAVSPVMNKIRELLRSSFLRPLLCARRTTLDLAQLWQRPGLVLVRLDRTALGDEGARLLAGMLTHNLLRTALRDTGPTPVSLVIDELPVLERFVGGAISEIVTVARSQGLRLLVACQHLAQLSDGLRSALLANAAVQGFFRLGHADARLVAASLAVGSEPRVTRLVAGIDREDRETGMPEMTEWRHTIRDPYGRRLRISSAARQRLFRDHRAGGDPAVDLKALAAAAGVCRLYIRSPDSGEAVELGRYVAGLDRSAYRIDGPSLQLVVPFPRPRFTGVERSTESDAVRDWTHCLQELPVRHAVVRVANRDARVVRVVDVGIPPGDQARCGRFVAASLAAHGQSAAEIAATSRWRQQQVERSGPSDSAEEVNDGSLA